MKLIIENWRRFLNEQSGGSIENIINEMFQDKHVLDGKPWGRILRARALKIKDTIKKAAVASEMDPAGLLALIAVESSFIPGAKSSKSTATGYTQMLSSARKEIYEKRIGRIWHDDARQKPGTTKQRWQIEHFSPLSVAQAKQVMNYNESPEINILAGALYLSYLIKSHKRTTDEEDYEYSEDSTVGSYYRALCEYSGQGRENTDCSYAKKIEKILSYDTIEKGVGKK